MSDKKEILKKIINHIQNDTKEKIRSILLSEVEYTNKYQINEDTDPISIYVDKITPTFKLIEGQTWVTKISMETIIPGIHAFIWVNGFKVVELWKYHIYQRETTRPLYKKWKPLIDLIDVYHKFYNDDKESNIKIEEKLSNDLHQLVGISGGKSTHKKLRNPTQKMGHPEIAKHFNDKIGQYFIFLGLYAMNNQKPSLPIHCCPISTSIDVSQLIRETFPNEEIKFYYRNNLFYHGEPLIEKVDIVMNGKKMFQIYNNAEIEIIPYLEKNNQKVAAPAFALYMFFLNIYYIMLNNEELALRILRRNMSPIQHARRQLLNTSKFLIAGSYLPPNYRKSIVKDKFKKILGMNK